jgi:hypothetical protein
MELDRAFEAEAERLLDGDMQEAELLYGVSSTSLSVRERLAIVLAVPLLLGEHCRPVV